MATVIVTGPQGCGKTRVAGRLKSYFGCRGAVVEEWWPGDPVIAGALHLTHAEMRGRNVVQWQQRCPLSLRARQLSPPRRKPGLCASGLLARGAPFLPPDQAGMRASMARTLPPGH